MYSRGNLNFAGTSFSFNFSFNLNRITLQIKCKRSRCTRTAISPRQLRKVTATLTPPLILHLHSQIQFLLYSRKKGTSAICSHVGFRKLQLTPNVTPRVEWPVNFPDKSTDRPVLQQKKEPLSDPINPHLLPPRSKKNQITPS